MAVIVTFNKFTIINKTPVHYDPPSMKHFDDKKKRVGKQLFCRKHSSSLIIYSVTKCISFLLNFSQLDL